MRKAIKASAPSFGLAMLGDFEMEPVTWLWEPLLPTRRLCLLAADGGTGKGTLSIDLAVAAMGDKPFPGEEAPPPPASVLYLSHEDNTTQDILPRFVAAGASPESLATRVVIMDSANPAFTEPADEAVVEALASAVEDQIAAVGGPPLRLIVLDPLIQVVGDNDSNKLELVRKALDAACGLVSDRFDAALVGIHHNRKRSGRKEDIGHPRYAAIGSTAWVDRARVKLALVRDANDSERHSRVLMLTKGNMTNRPGSILCWRVGTETVEVAPGIWAPRVVFWEPIRDADVEEVYASCFKDPKSGGEVSKERGRIVEALAKRGPMTIRELSDHLSVNADNLRRKLAELRDSRLVHTSGRKGKAPLWVAGLGFDGDEPF